MCLETEKVRLCARPEPVMCVPSEMNIKEINIIINLSETQQNIFKVDKKILK